MHFRCLPMQMRYRLKYRKSFFNPYKTISGITDKTILYADAPDYGNLGDQAIALAVHKFASTYFPDYQVLEIPIEQFAKYAGILKKTLPRSCPIFLTGGGNMGDRYPIYEAARRYVISQFKDNKIVVFPQTCDYSQKITGRLFRRGSKHVYASHPQLLICAREYESYTKVSSWYPDTHCIICPDAALMIPFTAPAHIIRRGVGICLRDDSERALSTKNRQTVENYINRSSQYVLPISTCHTLEQYTSKSRAGEINSILNKIASCRLLITDRLHAMIFAYITQTPCVAFDNSNGKVRGVYEWLKHNPQIQLAENADDFSAKAEFAVNAQYCTKDFDGYFRQISDWIKGEKHG